jgi:MSHA biogenesis protein MshP
MALVTALFLLVVLSVITAAMVALSNVSHNTLVKSLQAAKVYYGAKAGLEWGIQQAVSSGPVPPPACPASPTVLNLNEAALAGVSVTVTCAAGTHGGTNNVFYVTSIATVGGAVGNPDYAERRMEATVSNIP